jgi:osmotically-inducible protein OsmY
MKIAVKMTCAMLAIGALSGCAGMLLGSQSTAESGSATRAPASPSAADNSISGVIRQRFSQDADISRYTIGIRTVSGSVTLSGTVGSYQVRDRAVWLAETTDGVRTVDSRIIVNTNL